MRAKPGALVPLADPSEPSDPEPRVEPRGTARVAILIDRGTVSAAEVTVLNALRSERAVVIGEPTAGALDYMSTSIVRFLATEWRWALGYPTITAHDQLPRGGMRGIGISPDVYVDWRSVADPIAEAERVLSGTRRR
jgi:C-terminal processing protease CtpA/Prc